MVHQANALIPRLILSLASLQNPACESKFPKHLGHTSEIIIIIFLYGRNINNSKVTKHKFQNEQPALHHQGRKLLIHHDLKVHEMSPGRAQEPPQSILGSVVS